MGESEQIQQQYRSRDELRQRAEQWVAQRFGASDETSQLQALRELSAFAADFAATFALSPALIAAAYLHNFVYNRLLIQADVEPVCGARVAWLCEEAARILGERSEGAARGKSRARQRVRHYIAAYRDPELGLLAVATLWARWQVAQAGTVAQRHSFAEEARHVFSPLLEMMGMRALREEVEEWLWRLHEPDAERVDAACRQLFDHLSAQISRVFAGATCVRRPCSPPAARLLPTEPIAAARAAGKLYPPIDLSVLVEDEEACYQALHWIHHLFQPVDGTVVDYLRQARINGARALQTTAIVPIEHQRVRVTFHICTHAMEEVNRWGLAALYADHAAEGDAAQPHVPGAWWNQAAEGYAQIAAAPMGSLPEVLHVFSPQGQLFRFHRGCTVVDFAYHVHTELADQCQRFYVNDDVAEPTTPLHHLDLVALEHDARAPGPTQVWLNAAHTSRARNSIERFLKRRGLGVDQGQKILDQRLRALEAHYGFNLPDHRLPQATVKAMRQYKLSRVDELMAEIAAGNIVADRILHPLFADEVIRQIRLPRESGARPHQLQIAQCCRPRPGEDIVGLPSRRQGEIQRLRVHRANCVRIPAHEEQIPLQWRLQPRLKLLVELQLTAHDEDGLLGDALAEIYARRPRATLHKVEAVADHGVARVRFHVEAEGSEVLEQIISALQELPGRTIVEVRQMRLPPSEMESALQLGAAGSVNPYSRLPVHEQAMFFGRSQELLQIYELLRAGVGNIWLMGQKRVGKTSLLFHLKNYYLKDRGFVLAFVDFQLLGSMATSNLYFEIANAVYNELQADPRIGDLGAPLPGLFAHQPPLQLIAYIRSIQSRLGANRLVLLLDEFSRTTDAYLQGTLQRSFFDEWRGLLQATAPDISYITVFQQQTYQSLSLHTQQQANDPSWHLMELGERLVLKSLSSQDVRRLIEWPMRNFLEYRPETLDHVAQLTGGNPFLIQTFCFKLTAHMARCDRRLVEDADIEAVRAEFMLPTESVFAHFVDAIKGSGHAVTQQLARLAGENQHGSVTWEALAAALPHVLPDKLRRTLASLTDNDILGQPAPECWQFCCRLFQQWLELNPI
ncbi:MAG: TGS domain-containing protein [Caldilineaceae bacterium]|nr:TGS domain-containing protein [Caldilineaceae bacterium]